VCPICQDASDAFPLAEYRPAPAPLQPTRRDASAAECDADAGSHASDEGHCCRRGSPCDASATEAAPTAGSPLDDAGASEPVLLFCAKCDEAFPPQFRRHCGHCGYDYGAGIAGEAPAIESGGGRAALVLLGLVSLAAACLAYFYYLFHRSS
jgi:hypothetical protein